MDRRGVNVLVLSDLWQPFPGGAERLMFNIARDLDRRPEFDVRVLTSYELAAQFDGPPVEFREVGVFTRRAEGAAVIRDALTSSTFRPDVVIVHHLFAYEFDEVLRRSRLPIVQIVLNTRRLAHARLAVYISDHVRAAVPSLGRRGDMTMIPPAFDDVVPDVAVDPCHRPYVGFIKPLEHKGVSLVYDIARHFPGPQRFLILRGEWQTLELIEDLHAQRPDERTAELQQASELGRALDRLAPRLREVLMLRFGLDGSPPRTLEEVGVIIGVTRERVRQLEGRALRELRTTAPGLELYLKS